MIEEQAEETPTVRMPAKPPLLTRFRRWLVRKIIKLAIVAAIFGCAYLYLSRNEKYAQYANFFEKNPPVIEVVSVPPGVGTEPGKILLRLEDRGTGLDELIVRSDQGGEIRDVLHKRYDKPKFEDLVEVPVSGKDLDLTEGNFDIIVSVFDRSFWSNGAKQILPLKVNFEKPKLEVVSAQHNAVTGGSELCFYRVSGVEEGSSGVQVGDIEFPGYPARLLDADFEAAPDIHFAYFAVPLQFDRNRDEIKAYARNSVGNMVTTPFYYKVQPVHYGRRVRDVDALFFETKMQELKERLEKSDPSIEVPADRAKEFSTVIDGLRMITEQKIRQVTAQAETRSNWENGFMRPPGASLRVDFGEVRDYMLDGEPVGSFVYTGAEHVTTNRLNVVAAAGGKVKFAGELGLYGTSVIIDHGFGLSTVYGYLDNATVSENAEVTAGAVIGHAGSSGFSDTPALLYEMRVRGIPVRPVEWWDQHWVRDHILQKIEDIKKQLNLLPGASSTGGAADSPEAE